LKLLVWLLMAFTTLGHTEVIKGLIKYIGVRVG